MPFTVRERKCRHRASECYVGLRNTTCDYRTAEVVGDLRKEANGKVATGPCGIQIPDLRLQSHDGRAVGSGQAQFHSGARLPVGRVQYQGLAGQYQPGSPLPPGEPAAQFLHLQRPGEKGGPVQPRIEGVQVEPAAARIHSQHSRDPLQARPDVAGLDAKVVEQPNGRVSPRVAAPDQPRFGVAHISPGLEFRPEVGKPARRYGVHKRRQVLQAQETPAQGQQSKPGVVIAYLHIDFGAGRPGETLAVQFQIAGRNRPPGVQAGAFQGHMDLPVVRVDAAVVADAHLSQFQRQRCLLRLAAGEVHPERDIARSGRRQRHRLIEQIRHRGQIEAAGFAKQPPLRLRVPEPSLGSQFGRHFEALGQVPWRVGPGFDHDTVRFPDQLQTDIFKGPLTLPNVVGKGETAIVHDDGHLGDIRK